jgi:hypothetical protein
MQCACVIVTCHLPTLQYFSTYPVNGMIFENKLLNIKCVFQDSLQLFSKTFFILRRTERDMIKNVYRSLCKELFSLSAFNETSDLSKYFRKTIKYQILIGPVGAELCQADRLTDRHNEANRRFSQFRECVKKLPNIFHVCLSKKLDDLCFYPPNTHKERWDWRIYCTVPNQMGRAVAQWLRCCATNTQFAGSIPDGVIGIFQLHNPSGHTMALRSTQPLTEMSTSCISWG